MADLHSAQQYLRKARLTVSGVSGSGLDLSELRIKFSIKKTDTETPNTADIRVYNIKDSDAIRVRDEFKQVQFSAGYESNFGVVFQGNIIQAIIGRESATDTFIDLNCADGDHAYNFAVVNGTLAKGSSFANQIQAAVDSMKPYGVTLGPVGEMTTTKLPRGKSMYGNARKYLRNTAESLNKQWSIQDGKVTFVGDTTYLPGVAVVLNSNTGMIGTPQQTNTGVNVKCLLNPNIKVAGLVQIDEKSVAKFKLDLAAVNAANAANTAVPIMAPLSADGAYYVLVMEHTGDTRGVDWYTSLVCLSANTTVNPRNAISG